MRKVPFFALFLLYGPAVTCRAGYLDFDETCDGTNLDYRQMADTLLRFQVQSGGWEKNKPVEAGWDDDDFRKSYGTFDPGQPSCFDNQGSVREAKFLARAYTVHADPRYLHASERAFDVIIAAQYANGGWAQYYPRRGGYSDAVTFNDDLHVNLATYLDLIRDKGSCPFSGMEWDGVRRDEAGTAGARALSLILDAQIERCGRKTVWCAQHHRDTLKPVGARDYELSSFSGYESKGVWRYLMEVDDPSERVREAVRGAYEWFEGYKVEDWELTPDKKTLTRNYGAKQMARFYRIESYPTPEVIFCSRGCMEDSDKKYTEKSPFDHLDEAYAQVSEERRTGYSWLVRFPAKEVEMFDGWSDKYGYAPPTGPTQPCTASPTAAPSTKNQTLCDTIAYMRGEPCLDIVNVCEAVANLAANGKESCDAWCGRSGLRCGGAWHDDAGTCTKKSAIGCDRTGASGSICRCQINISPTFVPSPAPVGPTSAPFTKNPTGAGLCDTLAHIRGEPCLNTNGVCEAVANLAANGKESCDAWCGRSNLRI